MLICDASTKYQFNVPFNESKVKYDETTKYALSEITEIEIFEIVANAEPSMN
jgi:hypothetical protein